MFVALSFILLIISTSSATENNITVGTTQAPQFDSEVYAKEALHLSSAAFASGDANYIKVSSGKGNYNLVDGEYVSVGSGNGNYIKMTAGNYNTGGYSPIYSMIKNTKEKLGSVDYSYYNYLRFRFNVFVNDLTDGVILRLARYNSANNDVYSKDYAFGIGAGSFSNYTANNSLETYTSKSLAVGKWNDVMLELGVQAGNSTVNLYVNGESKSMSASVASGNTVSFGVNNGVGYCGASANRCYIGPKSSFGEVLDMYLSDVSLTVAKTAYNAAGAVYPSLEAAESTVVVSDKNIFTRDVNNVTDEAFTKANTDYFALVDDNSRVFTYNNYAKTFKYYNISTSGFATKFNSVDYSGEKTNVNIEFINVSYGNSITSATVVVAYYKETEGAPKLVMAKFLEESTADLYNLVEEEVDKPEAEFDYVKVFALKDKDALRSLGRAQTF